MKTIIITSIIIGVIISMGVVVGYPRYQEAKEVKEFEKMFDWQAKVYGLNCEMLVRATLPDGSDVSRTMHDEQCLLSDQALIQIFIEEVNRDLEPDITRRDLSNFSIQRPDFLKMRLGLRIFKKQDTIIHLFGLAQKGKLSKTTINLAEVEFTTLDAGQANYERTYIKLPKSYFSLFFDYDPFLFNGSKWKVGGVASHVTLNGIKTFLPAPK